jgi:hypothetical protein
MSLEQIIARLIGQAETADASPRPQSPADRRVLSRRLRAIVGDDAGERGSEAPDRGPAADALKLAAYLDGGMSASERDAFEAELVRSPARRDDLIAAVEWIEQISAQRAMPPADATALAIALERDPPSTPAKHSAGLTGWIGWLPPRPRLAIVTSALATFAIVAVGIDIALHTNPQFREAIQSQSSPAGGSDAPAWQHDATRLPPSNAQSQRPLLPPAPQLGDPILLTAETINALIAYRDDPTGSRRQELLAALVRAGAPEIPADRVRSVALQPQLYERLTQPRGSLPAQISARLSIDGELAIAIAR